ncbi:vWA domain-containing protein [Bacillus sp. FJAT-27245]|uniref:vWA domain-containing protein n=1 Tax=Bacillus sp. FJAT-27245 TaxID=1684144 RepID=UPI0006A78001|nr:vWA domain-containing protein [Bacillus sp. FJAT-27245]
MNKDLTEIIVLLDRSGSMAGLEQDTIGGFNSFLKRQTSLEGETLVTAVLFDDKYQILWNGVKAENAELTDKEYFVRGSTALLDAVGRTIVDVGCRLSKTEEERRPGKVIFVITTDGMENASREFTYEKVKELIRHQQERYSWEFIFMGANIDAAQEAGNLGIAQKHSYHFEASHTGVEKMYEMVTEAVSEVRKRQ